MNLSPTLPRSSRHPMRSSGAIGGLLAILLNVLLPLALAVSMRTTDPFDFSEAICHGGGGRAAIGNHAGTPTSDPSRGSGDHDCCTACLLSLAHALIPPQAGGAILTAPSRIVRGPDGNVSAPRQSLPPPFRSRAPPITA